ncbi:MAG: hypothetical protein HY289_01225 [Planctomycetes bacterium]|nr:hypothetical protein [Planctomycetota bacterium]
MSGRYQAEFGGRPRLLLAYADAAFASECGRYFRRLGWEVQMVASSVEARDLAAEYQPDVVALDETLLDESGWLSMEHPDLRMVVVTDEPAAQLPPAGMHYVARRHGAEGLATSILGRQSLSEAV